MSDNHDPVVPIHTQRTIVHRMTITLFADGNFSVEGIPSSATDAYGLLMLAYESILKKRIASEQAQRSGIIVPRGPLPPGLG